MRLSAAHYFAEQSFYFLNAHALGAKSRKNILGSYRRANFKLSNHISFAVVQVDSPRSRVCFRPCVVELERFGDIGRLLLSINFVIVPFIIREKNNIAE